METNNWGEGHSQREWVRVRNNFVASGVMNADDLAGCNAQQRNFINEFKKALKALTENEHDE